MQADEEVELKSCPFCGSGAELKVDVTYGDNSYYIECINCCAQSTFEGHKEMAICGWNARASDQWRSVEDVPPDNIPLWIYYDKTVYSHINRTEIIQGFYSVNNFMGMSTDGDGEHIHLYRDRVLYWMPMIIPEAPK